MTDSQKLDLILSGLQGVKDDVQGLKSLKNDVQVLKDDMQGLRGEVQGLKGEVQGLKGDVQVMKSDIQKLDRKVAGMEMHIENVTDKNITFIAEGHLDLSRKLDEALKVEQLKELYFIRTNIALDEIRKIKERLDETA
ncbi:MAG: hypothetical protein HFI29_04110 [Lachnospiraceae bacterium]|jgi:predicted RNase H-like nuclease (RuvC/YqgF family)|nr:hypothetical protein [Lachnospiraceae bacterium]